MSVLNCNTKQQIYCEGDAICFFPLMQTSVCRLEPGAYLRGALGHGPPLGRQDRIISIK